MRLRTILGVGLAAAVLTGMAVAADTLKSGPQVGSSDIPAFNPLHATGRGAGGKACLV